MTIKGRVWGAVAVSALGLGAAAHAEELLIHNSGFETDVLADGGFMWGVTDWTVMGSAGVFNPTVAQFLLEAPEGQNTGFSNSGLLSQVLGDYLAEGTAYTLLVEIGNRMDTAGFPGYAVQLWAGDSLLAEDVSMFAAEGVFDTSIVEFDAYAGDPRLGLPLEIRLFSLGGPQVNFDNVRLDATPIPAPAALGLLALAAARRSRRRRV